MSRPTYRKIPTSVDFFSKPGVPQTLRLSFPTKEILLNKPRVYKVLVTKIQCLKSLTGLLSVLHTTNTLGYTAQTAEENMQNTGRFVLRRTLKSTNCSWERTGASRKGPAGNCGPFTPAQGSVLR